MKQYKQFKLSVLGDGIEELNQFLRASTILSEERQFVENGETSFWAMLFCWSFIDCNNYFSAI